MQTPGVPDTGRYGAGAMSAPIESLVAVEQLERDRFRGQTPDEGLPRVFGGLVAAQALRAAIATIETDHRPHSMHAYFIRPGANHTPIYYRVDRIRDGRSFSTRTVVAIQRGEAIFNLSASFQTPEDGPEFQVPAPLDVPDPDDLEDGAYWGPARDRPVDLREFATPPLGPGNRSTRRIWVRAKGTLPDDPGLHACAIAYASDMGPVGAARRPLGGPETFASLMAASLDHAIWFHRPVRADEWLLYDLEAVSTSHARGLARGTMHTRAGVLAASVAQEALLRPIRPRA